MKLRLLHNFALKVALEVPSHPAVDDDKIHLRYGPSFRADEPNKFAIAFEIKVTLEDGAVIQAEYYSVFETDEQVDDAFGESNWVKINAPAIAFPFLRAFIAQFSLLAGYKPLVIPSINFAEKAKDPKVFVPVEREKVSLAAPY